MANALTFESLRAVSRVDNPPLLDWFVGDYANDDHKSGTILAYALTNGLNNIVEWCHTQTKYEKVNSLSLDISTVDWIQFFWNTETVVGVVQKMIDGGELYKDTLSTIYAEALTGDSEQHMAVVELLRDRM